MQKFTTEDYFNALDKLEYIKREEVKYYILLNNHNISCKNKNQIFKNTITLLNDKNNNYKKIIEIKIKNFLKKYKNNDNLYNLFKEKIKFIVYNLLNNPIENNNIDLDIESQIIIKNDSSFEYLLDDLKRLISKTKKNNLEIEHLKSLIADKKHAIELKDKFHNQSKKTYTKILKPMYNKNKTINDN